LSQYINLYAIRQELINFIRGQDVFSTTQRGVTTTTATTSLSSATTWSIATANIKNIRSVTIAGSTATYGTDYDPVFGSTTTTLTFTAAQTGASTATFDYGTSDKIWPDFPKNQLTISDFPRIAVDFIGITTEPGGFGNVNISTIDFTVVVYDFKTKDLDTYLQRIRQAFIDYFKNFHYFNYVRPLRVGPILKSPFEKGKDKVLQQSSDWRIYFQLEKN